MAARQVAEGRRIVVATPEYLQRHGTPMSPGGLISLQAVIYTRDGGCESWTFRKATAEVSVVLQGRLKLTAAEGLREAGELRHGVVGVLGVDFLARAEIRILKDWPCRRPT